NAALKIASGEFLGFVDSDDWLAPDMCESMIRACERYHADIAVCGYYNTPSPFDRLSCSLKKTAVFDRRQAMRCYLSRPVIGTVIWNKIYRRELFAGLWFVEKRYNEDEFIMHELFHRAKKVVHIGQCKYFYRRTENSLTRSPFSRAKMDLIDAVKTKQNFIKCNYPELYPETIASLARALLELLYEIEVDPNRDQFGREKKFLINFLNKNYCEIAGGAHVGLRLKLLSRIALKNPNLFRAICQVGATEDFVKKIGRKLLINNSERIE
ncbi:MAG TPA: glycosyltransferase, partial [Clostridia bacterium]|nr:glycosyltransferase [Clostridia bacterium]